jgi:predicted Zn-dependent protease
VSRQSSIVISTSSRFIEALRGLRTDPQLLATAGYDPRAAQDLWELMTAVEADAIALGKSSGGVQDKFALLRTHPTSEERHAKLEEDMPEAINVWKEARATKVVGTKIGVAE